MNVNVKTNVMLFGVVESVSNVVEDRINHDKLNVTDMLTKLGVGQEIPRKIIRIGKPTVSNMRPIKLIFESQEIAKKVIQSARNLKIKTVKQDLTTMQREELKTCLRELDDRKGRGELNLKIKYVNGVPKIFRHGHRTTERSASSLYPNDPYKNEKYYPYGYGQLTNKGKRKAFALGQWLRKRYNAFLGNLYHPNIMDAVSSGYNRTSATLSIVLAGLYPPKGTDLDWNKNLNWQPVLYNQLSSKENYLSLALATCPRFIKLFDEYLNTSAAKTKIQLYKPLSNYIQEKSGGALPDMISAVFFYDILATQQEWGLKLPKWAELIYPNILYGASLDFYEMMMTTTEMKRLNIGKISNKILPPERKLFIYSGHDYNLTFLQIVLGAYTKHRPTYGACLIIEVHQINKVYGIKIYYDTTSKGHPKLLKISGCNYFCPFKKFYSLVKQYLPTRDTNCSTTTINSHSDFATMFKL
ncbi:hypothetical protein RN001_004244 [Aquatica leii]|uniref:acid phosphatase n=1 Tax=Aquatica leii TaxID=1421715 RepID=A0AAN7Q5M1_9COLE|nr:hypothetical protein RN001_004244 [Aquatica leii]